MDLVALTETIIKKLVADPESVSVKEFETDVKEGKDIDIKDYVENDFVDYSSPMSKVGSKLSSSIDNFMNNGFSDFFNFVSRLFT